MLKLFRDSLFNPKNIIYYRAKKAWYVILYMLLVSIPYIIASMLPALNFSGLDYQNKTVINEQFEISNAEIVNYSYSADKSFYVSISGYSVAFLSDTDTFESYYEETGIVPSFIVKGSEVLVPSVTFSKVSTSAIYSLDKALTSEFENYDLTKMTIDDAFYTRINTVLESIKPVICVVYGVMGLISSISTMLVYALISYIYLNLVVKAKKYMKKGQLYKMLIFASTGVIMAETIVSLFNLSTIFSFIAIFIGFIPFFKLEREFIRRIKAQQLGEEIMDNPTIIDKINDLFKKKEDDDSNNNGSEE